MYPPTREEERAITIAYTALWQYREATTDTYGNTHEPPALFAARLDLRRRLDIIDAETTVDLTREERNLLAGLIGNRMWFWGDALMYSKRQLKKGQRKAADRVARVTRLSEVIGWKTHVKRKKARGRVWTVPFGILLPAIDALLDEFRDELADMARMADREKEAGKSLEESSLRRDIALKNGYLGRLLDLRTKAEEAVEGGRP